jgi:hypothetical protein
VLDRDDRFLTYFPSVAELERDSNQAYYPAQDVARLTDSAGMVWVQDQVDTPREVIDRYPGLYEHARMATWLAYLTTLAYVPVGLVLMMFLFHYPPLPGDGPGLWFVRLLMFGVGAEFIGLGVFLFPPILRRHQQRMKALSGRLDHRGSPVGPAGESPQIKR